MNNSAIRPKRWTFFAYLLPSVLLYAFMVLVPLVLALRYSFYKWSGGPKMEWIGLRNYEVLLQDAKFWGAFLNNLIIVGFSVVGQIGIAFVIAVFLMNKWVKWREFHRTVIFIPVVLSSVVIGFLWSMIFNNDAGLLNWLLTTLGLESWIKPWLDDPNVVMYSVTAPIVWQYIGFYLIIFMASMQSINGEVYEMAEIDGATGFKKTMYITLPLLKDTMKIAVMLCIAGNMKAFDSIFVMTGGGPGNSSTVMAQYAYDTSFKAFKLGYGSAISIGIMVLSVFLILLSRLIGGKNND
ncbi:sugar ABC transporter permease [Paenibacillus thiaminolyticus]|uniref:carbohydrate ABC transporter permease n=1 Tax=Paenibacillus thiaminolyticus TaxID=49283 RepID=UPI00232B0BD0|nr:sugar ABC transporter permease [Paenibacillus thiaminolyticus]WCF09619.1 sugar ABC transporter permease [Paenibacillus thiaminolyticus]WII38829.1 sugar ABC transporter permease [Paenibacillus thiaminolyticus]